eukprot:TRINITY_DN56133_c0_g1_i1.p1 TRINITY_DN56133_c0_g1~~TRINITY_DN56133_c0_g1_i1.p1  ORF type:complete len:289 (+),score=76.13 TRINITY_DN56133_c0_g1_i1:91-867(+)
MGPPGGGQLPPPRVLAALIIAAGCAYCYIKRRRRRRRLRAPPTHREFVVPEGEPGSGIGFSLSIPAYWEVRTGDPRCGEEPSPRSSSSAAGSGSSFARQWRFYSAVQEDEQSPELLLILDRLGNPHISLQEVMEHYVQLARRGTADVRGIESHGSLVSGEFEPLQGQSPDVQFLEQENFFHPDVQDAADSEDGLAGTGDPTDMQWICVCLHGGYAWIFQVFGRVAHVDPFARKAREVAQTLHFLHSRERASRPECVVQ